MPCPRHPLAAPHRQYCSACLLEEALEPSYSVGRVSMESLVVQVPLGRSAAASVFLVRSAGNDPRLLRLKVWHTPAPSGFLQEFQDLHTRIAAWPERAIAAPLAASVDESGCPSVLSEFRQGIPILDRVRSGRLDPDTALTCLAILSAVMLAAHARGLVHGSIVAGNVLVERGSVSPCLLDFGLASLRERPGSGGPSAAGDMAGFASLALALRDLPPGPGPPAPP